MSKIADNVEEIRSAISNDCILWTRYNKFGIYNSKESDFYSYQESYSGLKIHIDDGKRACIVESNGTYKLIGEGDISVRGAIGSELGVDITSNNSQFEFFNPPEAFIRKSHPWGNVSAAEIISNSEYTQNNVSLNAYDIGFFTSRQLSTESDTVHQFGIVSYNDVLNKRSSDISQTDSKYLRATTANVWNSENYQARAEFLIELGNYGGIGFDYASGVYQDGGYFGDDGTWTNQKAEDIPGIHWICDLFPVGIIATKSYDAGVKYIDDGTIPKDARIYTPDGKGIGTDKDNPESKYDGTTSNEFPPVDLPDVHIQTTGNTFYVMQAPKAKAVTGWLWGGPDLTDSIINKFTSLYSGIEQTIISMTYYPFWYNFDRTQKNIKYGRLESDINAYMITESNIINMDVGSIKIYPKYYTFADLKPYTEMMLYLPYASTIPIDTNIFMEITPDKNHPIRTLKVKLVIDVLSGAGLYIVCCEDTPIYQVPCQMGYQIPLVLNSSIDMYTGLADSCISAGISLAVGAATGPAGMVAGAVSASGEVANGVNASPIQVSGCNTPAAALGGPQQCMLIRKNPMYTRLTPEDYGRLKGYPCEQSYKLSELSGFTQIFNPVISNFGTQNVPTDAEIEEIYSLMRGGIYL